METTTASHLRHRVVIVGGGFAGLYAAKGLRSDRLDVTLVDRQNHHVFSPLLYQVATAQLAPGDRPAVAVAAPWPRQHPGPAW